MIVLAAFGAVVGGVATGFLALIPALLIVCSEPVKARKQY